MNPESELLSEHLPVIYEREHFCQALWGTRGVCGQGEGAGHMFSCHGIWSLECDIAVSIRKGLKERPLLGMKKIKRTKNRDIEQNSDNHSQFKMVPCVMKDKERPRTYPRLKTKET